ncbi:hypothetical protein [Achromobacter pestifer]|uniref:DUF4440 domain-containing protein n=1 Tax=Achromobacter pestifer TaxID=1353889 RepID=A0A6S6YPL3_9BURK|nr:hypothetical protein [Achromobacter pestifer]CAB3625673.1 hypothetical protein LMG3431_00194 [Achromobacter pestifer]
MALPIANNTAMTDLPSTCLRLTLDAHALIEQWIGQPDAPDTVLAALLSGFAPDFTMITTDGQRLPRNTLPALFGSLRGARPGLKIDIDEMTLHHADSASALLSYRERHAWTHGATQRRATVLFTAAADSPPQWAHLHETWA